MAWSTIEKLLSGIVSARELNLSWGVFASEFRTIYDFHVIKLHQNPVFYINKGGTLQAMNSFISKGIRISFVDLQPESGNAHPIVLVHGFASTHKVNWVDTSWTSTLLKAGYRVIAFDNRGHGESEKLYDSKLYSPAEMANDLINLLDHLGLSTAHVMGYSMGARIAAVAAVQHQNRLESVILGGLGIHLVEGEGLPPGIADALELEDGQKIHDPVQRMFRDFAERNRGDLKALAACMRGSRKGLTQDDLAQIKIPILIAVGSKDLIAGDPIRLSALIPRSNVFIIEGRDHNLAVGDRTYKAEVLDFLARQ